MQTRAKKAILILTTFSIVVGVIWGIEMISTQALTAHHAKPKHPLSGFPLAEAATDGNRLAHIDGCFRCHGDQLTGRIVFADRLGTQIVAPNLTRLVREQSDAQLATAILYGVKRDGTSVIYMPSNQFIKSSDSDTAAVIAYLRSLPLKSDTAGKTRMGLGGRAMLTADLLPVEAGLVDTSERGPWQTPTSPLNLGRYITQAHCSTCHGDDLSGETIKDFPDLRVSIEHYSPMTFAHFFKTGEGQSGHGTTTMTRMIQSRFKYFTPEEVHAIYVYLKAGALHS